MLNAIRRILSMKFSDYYISLPFAKREAGMDKIEDLMRKLNI